MSTTSVTSKGQVTIPQALRKRLGIRRGSRVEFKLVDDHLEMRVFRHSNSVPDSGFGLLKTERRPAPVDLDPAALLEPGRS